MICEMVTVAKKIKKMPAGLVRRKIRVIKYNKNIKKAACVRNGCRIKRVLAFRSN